MCLIVQIEVQIQIRPQASLEALSMRDLGRAMQAVTDAWALGAAMPALDEFTYLRARCRACLSCIRVLLSEIWNSV